MKLIYKKSLAMVFIAFIVLLQGCTHKVLPNAYDTLRLNNKIEASECILISREQVTNLLGFGPDIHIKNAEILMLNRVIEKGGNAYIKHYLSAGMGEPGNATFDVYKCPDGYNPKLIANIKNSELNEQYKKLYRQNIEQTSVSNSELQELYLHYPQKTLDETKWLIVLGIEKYDETDNIKYSKRSSELFVKVAQKTLGVSERNTYSLIEEKSTSGAIKDKLELMMKNIKQGDTIYFYYSGHGIPVLPDNEPYILPKDKMPEMIGKDDFFKLRNIYKMLSDSKALKVVAFVDSCFSGATDGVSIIKGVAAARLIPKKVTFDKSKMVVFTAGKDKQYSNVYEEKGHRLFSYFVMKSLLKGKTNAKDIYAEVYTNVKDESFKMGDLKVQEPQIEGNLEMGL